MLIMHAVLVRPAWWWIQPNDSNNLPKNTSQIELHDLSMLLRAKKTPKQPNELFYFWPRGDVRLPADIAEVKKKHWHQTSLWIKWITNVLSLPFPGPSWARRMLFFWMDRFFFLSNISPWLFWPRATNCNHLFVDRNSCLRQCFRVVWKERRKMKIKSVNIK